MNAEFEKKNKDITKAIKGGTSFELIHKGINSFEHEPEGYWVSVADEYLGYYDMVLINSSVEELRQKAENKFNNEVFINASSSAYAELVENWIPLPVLFEGLGLYHNFKDYNDLKVREAIEMIESKIISYDNLPNKTHRTHLTKKCGSLSTL